MKETLRECDVVTLRRDTSVHENEKDLHWVHSSGDENGRKPNLLLVSICISSGLSSVKNHELQHVDRTRGRTKVRSSKEKLLQELSSGQEVSHEEKQSQ